MSLLFNMLSWCVIGFLPSSNCFLISWLSHHVQWFWSLRKWSLSLFPFPPFYCHEVMGPDAMIFVFWILRFKLAFSLFSFTFIKRLFSFSLLSAIRVVSSAYLRLLIFLPASLVPASASSAWHLAWCPLHRSEINRVTIYSLDILLSQFGTSPLFHVWF